jgi:Homeodomain-like domain
MRERAQELRAAGYSIRAIAAELGVPKSTVGDWLRGPAVSRPARSFGGESSGTQHDDAGEGKGISLVALGVVGAVAAAGVALWVWLMRGTG